MVTCPEPTVDLKIGLYHSAS